MGINSNNKAKNAFKKLHQGEILETAKYLLDQDSAKIAFLPLSHMCASTKKD